ncbi:MAG: permease-like cell division protein FtsX [Melioribacteraceae bacterium]|nr:permease-like cell division protein FtsX [Melioribacteraceae bacterium]
MISFYLKEAAKNLMRAKIASFVAFLSTTLAIILCYLSIGLIFGSNYLEEKINRQVELNFFVADSIDSASFNELKKILLSDARFSDIKFVSKQEAAETFIEETGEDFREVLELNPLPASFKIFLKNQFMNKSAIEQITSDYEKNDLITEIVYDRKLLVRIFQFFETSKKIIYSIAVVLIVLSFYLVYLINRLILSTRKKEFDTMRLVGSKISNIKIPIFLVNLVIGFSASVVSLIIVNFVIYVIQKTYFTFSFTILIYFTNFIILSLGLLFGFLNGLFSTRKMNLKITNYS